MGITKGLWCAGISGKAFAAQYSFRGSD